MYFIVLFEFTRNNKFIFLLLKKFTKLLLKLMNFSIFKVPKL
jgi:hypothetical protein